eukprot:CAMPEP_0204864816 /NCGR_PEP_ID=MMETSP1348-20121228/4341_1 /ASSEMBLY_ACC=CAM_ASM_000700 /TAXON_ID=215587 /ORGANISM="Aplanochytrium stocchinoi, Strain GSBS06" /LENGTH=92 /DNA_ID=CAMNT_0052015581 /DNA_START=494 /DNA_END=769 /DNA_ORIENTATION=+
MKGVLPEEDEEEGKPLLDVEKHRDASKALIDLIVQRLQESYRIIEEAGEKFIVIEGQTINITELLKRSEEQLDEINQTLQKSDKGIQQIEKW